MTREEAGKIARANVTNVFAAERHVKIAVREYNMLQNIGNKTMSDAAQFFNVSDDDITRCAWLDFLRGMQDSLTQSVYADWNNEKAK